MAYYLKKLIEFGVETRKGILWWTRVWKARNEKNPFEGIEIEFPHPPHSWDSRKYGAVQHRLTPSVPNKKNRPYAPHSWDWRKYGAVTPVQHQLNCSSCWAFTTTGAIEGLEKITSNTLIPLSAQQLVSCCPYCCGCKGGSLIGAFQYIIECGGITSSFDYPYTSEDSPCNDSWRHTKLTTIQGFRSWRDRPISDEYLRFLVYKQPIAVALYAGPKFDFYKGGDLYEGETYSWMFAPNHTVLIVGYGTTKRGDDCRIVKNSWGANWGIDGYCYIRRNTGMIGGVSNINYVGAYPIKRSHRSH